MLDLPSGTVTLLFTDIEGSTELLQRLGDDRYAQLLRDHDRLLRDIFQKWNGHEIGGQGDSLFVAFRYSKDALQAAIAAQLAIAAHRWPAAAPVRVRTALHTGEPTDVPGGYVGLDVHRAARICSAGHGGQILLSNAAATLVKQALSEELGLRDLGTHRLKGLNQPERIFQLLHARLAATFPPLRSLSVLPNNLPLQMTSFIGREREVTELQRLLTTTRLLTLTGAGGCGKTRLALQLAGSLLEQFADGVWLVELAALSDPIFVAPSIAAVLNVPEESARAWTETLVHHLRPASLLLVLDNCEHVVDACARVAQTLLGSCPGLRILATSREALRIDGETTFYVPSLSLPDTQTSSSLESLGLCDALRLFVDRAKAVRPAFALTARNAPSLVQVCHRLDGIPLAIELAAARIKMLSIEQIADRLDDRFNLLTGGSRTALPRHRTLRAAMDWSYDLLSQQEQALLRRLTVFSGGWTLEAAEAVCSGPGIDRGDILDLLARLIDKSLVIAEHRGESTRYRQLETVRQDGQDRLSAAGEAQTVRERYADWCLNMAESAEPALVRADQGTWLDRLEAEHDNMRAVLEWSVRSAQFELGLRLASAVWRFWTIRAYCEEGRGWLETLLRNGGAAPAALRAKALNAAGNIAMSGQNDYTAARKFFEESLAIWRTLENKAGIARALQNLGVIASNQGYQVAARSLYQESRGMYETLGDRWEIALSLNNEGFAAFRQGDHSAARALLEESLGMFRGLGDKARIATVLGGLADVALHVRDNAAGYEFLKESLAIRRELGVKGGIALSLEGFAGFAAAQGHAERAVRLLGAASALRDIIRTPMRRIDSAQYDRTVTSARAAVGEDAFAAAWAVGRAMTLEQAIDEALGKEGED